MGGSSREDKMSETKREYAALRAIRRELGDPKIAEHRGGIAASVPSSSAPISRLYPATSAARMRQGGASRSFFAQSGLAQAVHPPVEVFWRQV
jgi:hypothetical protein